MGHVLKGEQLRDVQATVLTYLSTHPHISNRQLRAVTQITYDQAIWVFNHLIETGFIERQGRGSASRYVRAGRQ